MNIFRNLVLVVIILVIIGLFWWKSQSSEEAPMEVSQTPVTETDSNSVSESSSESSSEVVVEPKIEIEIKQPEASAPSAGIKRRPRTAKTNTPEPVAQEPALPVPTVATPVNESVARFPDNQDIITFNLAQNDFSIKYPARWDRYDSEDFVGRQLHSFFPGKSSNRREANPDFRENVTVMVEDLVGTSWGTLEAFTRESEFQLEKFTGYQKLNGSLVLLEGVPAYQTEYVYRNNRGRIFTRQIWAVRENKAYIVTFSAENDEDLNAYNPIVWAITGSWQWE